MAEAARWLADEAPSAERFMLFVDEFDPHEPFDVPEPWMSRYDPDWDGPRVIWPPYAVDAVASGVIDERTARHIRANYGAKLSFVDHQFGRLLDELDRRDLWDDTAVIVCTDHGHYLGEHDIFGKPPVPIYETLGHIPLLVWWPGSDRNGTTVDALTTTVDLHATIADLFGVTGAIAHRTHGRSLRPVLDGTATSVRDHVLTGVWGREVHVLDGTHTYARAPEGANAPLVMLSNRWSTMPTNVLSRDQALPRPDDRAVLGRMPGSDVPVIRQVWDESDPVPFWSWGGFRGHHLWNVIDDPSQDVDLAGRPEAAAVERELTTVLHDLLVELEAPPEQLVRLGLR